MGNLFSNRTNRENDIRRQVRSEVIAEMRKYMEDTTQSNFLDKTCKLAQNLWALIECCLQLFFHLLYASLVFITCSWFVDCCACCEFLVLRSLKLLALYYFLMHAILSNILNPSHPPFDFTMRTLSLIEPEMTSFDRCLLCFVCDCGTFYSI